MTPEEFDVLYDRFVTGRLTREEGERLRECLADPLWKRRWRDLSDLDGMLADEFQGASREEAARRGPVQDRGGRRAPTGRLFWIPAGVAAAAFILVSLWISGAFHGSRPPGEGAPATRRPDPEEVARRECERLEDTQRKIQEHLAALERQRQRLAAGTPEKPPAPAEDESRRRELERIEVDRKALEEEMARTVEEARRAREKLPRMPEEAPEEPAPVARIGETLAAVARLGRVRGRVSVFSVDGEVPPREGNEILAGEGVRTAGGDGMAEVLFPDGTRAELAADGVIGRINGARVSLERGNLSAEVARRPAGRPFVFTTPHAEARILGTRLSLAVTAEATRLEVREGRVRLKRLRDGATLDVAAGHEASVNGKGSLASKPLPGLTVSFQDGVSPEPAYAGTRDTSITALSPSENLGAAGTLGADGDDQGKDISALLRWDVSAIPPGSRVLAAEITLTVTGTTGTDAYKLLEMRRPWSESEATWKTASAGHPWQSPGARGGADRGAAVLGWVSAPGKGERSFRLNEAGVAVVQSWVSVPAANFGLIIAETSRRNGLDFSSREVPHPSRRPRLTVTYLPADRR